MWELKVLTISRGKKSERERERESESVPMIMAYFEGFILIEYSLSA